MVKVAILAVDNTKSSGWLDQYIDRVGRKYFIDFDVEIFFNVCEMKKEICFEKKYYDIIGLDIKLEGKEEIELVKNIRKANKNVVIIFLEKQISDIDVCLDIQPFLFLQKPFELRDVENAMLAAYKELMTKRVFFEYKFNRCFFKISLKDIKYFESNKKNIFINTVYGKRKMYGKKLDEIEYIVRKSNIPFLRIHKSILVNYLFVEKISKEQVFLYNNETLPISENGYRNIQKRFGDCDHCHIVVI